MTETEKLPLVERLPWYAVPAVLLGVPLLVYLLTLIQPETFYDNFVEKYYWGPIRDDAGYNPVNTATWALLLGVCVLGLTQLMRGLKQPVNNWIIFGATAWVLVGSAWHVLEDVELFSNLSEGGWLKYIYITPSIYLLFGAGGVLSLAVGKYIQDAANAAGLRVALSKLWLLLTIPILVYLWAWTQQWDQVTIYISPLAVAIYALITFLIIKLRVERTGRVAQQEFVALLAIFPALVCIHYFASFSAEPWHPQSPRALENVLWQSALLAGGATALIRFLVLKIKHGDAKWSAAFNNPTNLAILFAQGLDGFATAFGIDVASYGEKHPLSRGVIEGFQGFAESIGFELGAAYPTFFAFVPLKLALAFLVVYAIDVSDDSKKGDLVGFIKFAIIMVGFGPGMRNAIRLTFGV